MASPNIYPFTIPATDWGYARTPELAERIWQTNRRTIAPGLIWYAADLVVLSPAEIRIDVRGMENSFSGGIGKVIFTYHPVLTANDMLELYNDYILPEQTSTAMAEYQVRKAAERKAEIEAIRKELFDASSI